MSDPTTVEMNTWQELIVAVFRPYSDLLDEIAGVSQNDQPPGTAS